MVKIFGNQFERLCWRLQREMRNNRKPILLLFGNGFESQILLLALHRLKKRFTIVHAFHHKLGKKACLVLSKFDKPKILLQVWDGEDKENKSWNLIHGKSIFFEKMKLGFPMSKYLIVTGFQIGGDPQLIRSYRDGTFDGLYCPFLTFPEEWIQTIYQDMKDNDELGPFLLENNCSDSHQNIRVV